ncbi:MAG: immunoglobulin domain-containing protein [Verrucomicrobiota bacterium]
MNTSRNTLCLIAAGLFLAAPAVCHAQSTNLLYTAPTSGARDNYGGAVGCEFQVGSSNVVVSHLGYFSTNTSSGLNISHPVGILTANFSSPKLLAGVTVPAGAGAFWMSNYYWVQLNPPLLLSSNTSYFLAALPTSGDGDSWPDLFTPTWNSYFVGANGTGTRTGIYAPNSSAGDTLPPSGGFGAYEGNETYGAPEMAKIPVGPAYVGVQQTNVGTSVGLTLTLAGFATGQLPIMYQWYLAPNTALPRQTNATLVISNAQITNSGTYYLTATNALGGEQSANVTVSVTAVPVTISQQPTNITVYQNYTAKMSVTVSGSPPIYYQWSRNSAAIPGATSSSYSVAAALTNNADSYSCLVTNSISATNTANAVLTVIPNLAPPQELLHGYQPNIDTNNYTGMVGGVFEVGNSSVLVTHLGYYASQYDPTGTNASLTSDHHVGVFSPDGTVLYGSVDVPAGLNPVINGYMWAPLDPPLVLSNTASYLLAAQVFSGTDPWGDAYTPSDWNPYYVGTNPPSSQYVRYSASAWPTAPLYSYGSAGEIYSAPNMAVLAISASAVVEPTIVTQYAGTDVTLTASVAGQPPISVQWYEEPATQLGDTNLVLNLNAVTVGQSGSYYVIATNAAAAVGAQSPDAVVTVIPDTGPSITQDVQSQDAYVHQTVQFAVVTSGTPPMTYQWTFNGSAITGATNATLTLTDVSTASAGSYQLFVTNSYGWTNSSVATLQVTTPAWGSYPSAVMGSSLLLYYPLNDAGSGYGIATNWGSLGFACNGDYTNGYSAVAGPTNVNFGPDNLAVALDGYSGYVYVPALANVVVSNLTIAAWVYDTYPGSTAEANMTIFFQRSTYVFGLSVNPDPISGGDELRYTWNGTGYSFNSFLDLPTNQWAFTALVITPTNATLYLQNGTGMQSTNSPGANPSATFAGLSDIGYDTAGGGNLRFWNGSIANLMVFNTALSPVAVNALYLGVPASATLNIAPSGSNLVVTWPGGTLLEATNITGPWTPTIGATNGTYILRPSAARKFYRVQLQ